MEFVMKCNCKFRDNCKYIARVEEAVEELEDDYPSITEFDDAIIVGSKKFFWDGDISETDYSFKLSCGVLQRASDNHLKWIMKRLYFDTRLNERDDIWEDDEEDDGDGDCDDNDGGDNLTRAINRLSRAKGIEYSIEIIEDSEINAYALPEGKIKITSAAVEQLSEEEIAFLIGHEEAHIDGKHGQAKMEYLKACAEGFEQIFKDKKSGFFKKALKTAGLAGLTVAGLPLVSKACEVVADLEGQKRIKDAGYDEEDAGNFFDRIGPREGRYFSTHPTPQFRKKLLKK